MEKDLDIKFFFDGGWTYRIDRFETVWFVYGNKLVETIFDAESHKDALLSFLKRKE